MTTGSSSLISQNIEIIKVLDVVKVHALVARVPNGSFGWGKLGTSDEICGLLN